MRSSGRKHADKLASVVAVLLAVAGGCSKENTVEGGAPQNQDVTNLGQPCDASRADGFCGGGACVAGICRVKCETDANCKGSICLTEQAGSAGGCRLPSEEVCSSSKPCSTALLACGLDETCRIPCTESLPCPRNDLLCFDGACFGKLEEGADLWLCGGASPGDKKCQGADVQVCDVGGLGWVTQETCESACLNGACTGSCEPGKTECSGNSVVTCNADGTWGEGDPCTASACVAGACTGGCVPGEKRCTENSVQTCESDGTWNAGTACAGQACVSGSCAGVCEPDSLGCAGQQPRTCSATGQWVNAPTPCQDQACVDGACMGECEPGATKCVGNALETCGAQGQWGSGVACGGATPICSAGACSACPTTDGPVMVAVTGAEPYCIDSTEVTRDQYAAWLAGSPTTSGQDSWCFWNTSFVPTCQWPPGTKGGHPVVCVNWCDAYAYCKAIGRRLCGSIDGGANAWGDFNNATKSQWFNACTSGGQNDYPYGDTFDGQACNGDDKGVGSTVSAGSLSTCQSSVSGYAGVYDLSGNAYEWEDSCSGSLGSADACRVRGGSYYPDAAGAMRCDADTGLSAKRNIADDNVGFRCCAP